MVIFVLFSIMAMVFLGQIARVPGGVVFRRRLRGFCILQLQTSSGSENRAPNLERGARFQHQIVDVYTDSKHHFFRMRA